MPFSPCPSVGNCPCPTGQNTNKSYNESRKYPDCQCVAPAKFVKFLNACLLPTQPGYNAPDPDLPPPAPSCTRKSSVKIVPEATRVEQGKRMQINYTLNIDQSEDFIDSDKGWSHTQWYVNFDYMGDQTSFTFKQDKPGTYEVRVAVMTHLKQCNISGEGDNLLKDSIKIEVFPTPAPDAPPPPPPPPICGTGYALKDGKCVIVDNDDNGIPDEIECGAGKIKDANGNCVDDGDDNGIPDQEECGENFIKNASGQCVCDAGYILKDGKCMRDTDGDGTHDDEDEDIDGDGKNNDEDDDIDGDGIKNEDDDHPYIHDIMYAKALQSQYMGDVFYKEPSATRMGDEPTTSSQLPSTPLLVMGGLLVAFFLMPKQNK